MTDTAARIAVLAKHLDIEVTDIEAADFGDNTFKIGREEYLVLTDEEADEAVANYIRESVWAFKPEFIVEHCDLPPEATEMIAFFCEKKCEGANETVLALIDDFGKFVDDAVKADGRGHFLSHYDGEEHEVDGLFVYRTN